MSNVNSILIVKPSSLGDIINAFPAAWLIRKYMPEASIDWLVNDQLADVLEYLPFVRKVIPFPRRALGKPSLFLGSFIELMRKLRENNYDMVIDMQGLLRSAFFSKVTRHSEITGFENPKEKLAKLFYRRTVSPGKEHVHAVDKNIKLVSDSLGVKFEVVTEKLPVIEKFVSPLSGKLAAAGISEKDTCVGIAPGARWKSKTWPPSFFAEIIKNMSLKNHELKFIITGSPSDMAAASEIIRLCPDAKVFSFAGSTKIGELIELIRRCSILITNDSGPMHIAAILGKPAFAFFGPTDPDKTGPYGQIHSIFAPDIPCVKCLSRICPSENYRCHMSINGASVADQAILTLSQGNRL